MDTMASMNSPEEIRSKCASENEKIKIDICQEIVFENDDSDDERFVLMAKPQQNETVMIPSVKVTERVDQHLDASQSLFRRGKSYIKFSPKTMEEQDELVDYDLDTDDEEFVSQHKESLTEDDMEAAMHALEISSFRFMMSNVRVPEPLSPSDGYAPDFLLANDQEAENLDPMSQPRQKLDKPMKEGSLISKCQMKHSGGRRRKLKCLSSPRSEADSNLELNSTKVSPKIQSIANL